MGFPNIRRVRDIEHQKERIKLPEALTLKEFAVSWGVDNPVEGTLVLHYCKSQLLFIPNIETVHLGICLNGNTVAPETPSSFLVSPRLYSPFLLLPHLELLNKLGCTIHL